MPKDEFDFDDPLELNGVAMLTDEDTYAAMCECFIEEFLRMGYGHKQILAMFRNPHYLAMNMVVENKGEQFVRDQISEVFARWGRETRWNIPIREVLTVPDLELSDRELLCPSLHCDANSGTGTAEAGQAQRHRPDGSSRSSAAPTFESTCTCGGVSSCAAEPQTDVSAVDPLGNPAPQLNL